MSAVMAVRVCAKGICFPTYSDTKPSHKRRDWQQYHTTSDANGCHGRGDKSETQASVGDNGWEHRKQLLVGWLVECERVRVRVMWFGLERVAV